MRKSANTLDSEMSSEEILCLTQTLRENAFEGAHLEVGTAAGGTLCEMMKATHQRESQAPRWVVVDPMNYFENQLETVKKNMANHGIPANAADIRAQRSSSAWAEAEEKGETFDFILIDASHKIKHVTEDLRWARRLTMGGVLAMHDYTEPNNHVRTAVDRFTRKHPNYQTIGQAGSLIVLRKTSQSKTKEISDGDQLLAVLTGIWLQAKTSWKKRLRGK